MTARTSDTDVEDAGQPDPAKRPAQDLERATAEVARLRTLLKSKQALVEAERDKRLLERDRRLAERETRLAERARYHDLRDRFIELRNTYNELKRDVPNEKEKTGIRRTKEGELRHAMLRPGAASRSFEIFATIFAAIDQPDIRFAGISALATMMFKRRITDTAFQLLKALPLQTVAENNTAEAAFLFSTHDRARFDALVAHLGNGSSLPEPLWLKVLEALAYLDHPDFADWLSVGLERDLIESTDREVKTIVQWMAKVRAGPEPENLSDDRSSIGILAYRSPTRSSKNIGDPIQSLAMLAQFRLAGLTLTGEIGQALSGVFEGSDTASTAHDLPARIVVLDRDDLSTAPPRTTTWLPVFGWFAHKHFERHFDLRFAPSLKPLFISFHVARGDLLDAPALEVLFRCEPIGCRDYMTVRLLLSNGIRAFFSGCVTSSLGAVFGSEAPRAGHFTASYHKPPAGAAATNIFVPHNRDHLTTAAFADTIVEAADLMRLYASAESVTTDLLHCYMPCRAMMTPVTFTRSKLTDRRFEGLIGASDAEVSAMAARFGIFRDILRLALNGTKEEDVYAAWRDAWSAEERATRAYLDRCAIDLAVTPVDRAGFTGPYAVTPRADVAPAIDLAMCFDHNMAPHVMTTLAGVLAHATQGLRIHFITRGIDKLHVPPGGWPPQHEIVMYKAEQRGKDSLRLLSHTTASTMDRLLLPTLLKDVDKIIYLDVDVLLRRDISTLWQVDLGDHAMAARLSIHPEWRRGVSLVHEIAERYDNDQARDLRSYLFETGALDFDTFNAGVLVLSLARQRAAKAVEEGWALAERWGLHDQFILNIQARGNFTRLPDSWNHFPRQELVDDPSLVHFIGPVKSWHAPYQRFRDEWIAHAATAERWGCQWVMSADASA